MEELKKTVGFVILSELTRANRKFPKFNSSHEGYAVILEELQEAEDEINIVKLQVNELWKDIKTNDIDYALQHADMINKRATLLACEAVQVAAMAQKFQDSFKEVSK